MLLKITWKVLLDCDTMILFYYSTVYMVILFILLLLLSLSLPLYYPSNPDNMDID